MLFVSSSTGMAAQAMQSFGCKRTAPIVTLLLLLVISVGGMLSLSQLLEATPDWQSAASERAKPGS